MNSERVKRAEAEFLSRYPGGFDDPGLAPVRKKHRVDALADLAASRLARAEFRQPSQIVDTLVRIVSRSSMVSLFEKPKFRDFARGLSGADAHYLAAAMEQRLYGPDHEAGFTALVDMLAAHRIARWPVVSAVPFYFAPQAEAFVKPTTAKRIIAYLEVDKLHYQPRPDWQFYAGYRRLLDDVRAQVSPSLAANYATLSGFLMSALD